MLFFNVKYTSDGRAYYSYLRTLVFDKDLNFYNDREYGDNPPEEHLAHTKEVHSKQLEGYAPNPFSLGPAISWAPFFALTHLYIICKGPLNRDFIPDGYSFPYLIAICLGSIFWATVGMFLLFFLLSKKFSLKSSIMASMTIYFASPLTASISLDTTLSHCLSFFTVTLYIAMWWLTFGDESYKRFVLLGVAMGIAVLARWQDIGFSILLIGEFFYLLIRSKNLMNLSFIKRWLINFFIFFIFTLIVFSPQMALWHFIYGKFLLIPQGKGSMNWLGPKIISVLFSSDHGFFSWNPALIFCFVGLIWMTAEGNFFAVLLLLSVIFQIWVNASVIHWGGGKGFGMRRFINTLPALGIGMAYLWEKISFNLKTGLTNLSDPERNQADLIAPNSFEKPPVKSSKFLWLSFFTFLNIFIIWNFLLLGEYACGRLSGDFIADDFHRLILKPWTISLKPLLCQMGRSFVFGSLIRDEALHFLASFLMLCGVILFSALFSFFLMRGLNNIKHFKTSFIFQFCGVSLLFTIPFLLLIVKAGTQTRKIWEVNLAKSRLSPKMASFGGLLQLPELQPLIIGKNSPYEGRSGIAIPITENKKEVFLIKANRKWDGMSFVSYMAQNCENLTAGNPVGELTIIDEANDMHIISIKYGYHTYAALPYNQSPPIFPADSSLKISRCKLTTKPFYYFTSIISFPQPLNVKKIEISGLSSCPLYLVGIALEGKDEKAYVLKMLR